MANYNKRTNTISTKNISVRINDEEHKTIKAAALLSDHRSMAEFIREGVMTHAYKLIKG